MLNHVVTRFSFPQEREESQMSIKGESSMTRFEFYDDHEWFGRRQRYWLLGLEKWMFP